MFYTPAADELRAFIRDKLQFPFIDTGDGWLIFDAPAAEIGCHPSDRKFQGLSFYCDDLRKTMAELQRRGVEFTADVVEQDWGWVTRFRVPGGDEIELYQAKYAKRPLQSRKTARPTRRKRASTK
jgi:hypothetical protein